MGKTIDDFKRSELVKAAKEVDALGFDAHPNLKGKPDELRTYLAEAFPLLDEEDLEELSEETRDILDAINAEEAPEDGDDENEDESNDNNNKDEGEDMKKEAPAKKGKKKKEEAQDEAPAKKSKGKKNAPDTDADTEKLRLMIVSRNKLADLKALVEEEDAFKKLRKRLDEFKGIQGPRQLKAKMEACLGLGSKPAPAQKETPDEAPAKKSKGKKASGGGVIATIVDAIEKSGKKGISKEDILEKLVEKFPEREEAAMKKTINVQVPNRISKERFPVGIKNGRYFKEA